MIISFLLKKGTNQTPYSPISYFGKKNKIFIKKKNPPPPPPPRNHVHLSSLIIT
jgi:hypothetical protein